MCGSPPSRSFLNWRIVSQLHPSPISPYPRLKMCISTQSRSHLNPIQVSRFVSPLHPGSQIYVSSLSQMNLASFWVLVFTCRLHPGNISPPSSSTKLHLSSIQASSQTHTCFKMCVSPPSRSFLNWRIVSQLHPSPIPPYPHLKMCISTQSRSHLNPIQVSRFVSALHPGSQIHVSSLSQLILPQSGSWYLHFAYIQVTSHLHPAPPNCILVPSQHHLKPIQVSRCVSHLHPGPSSTGSRSQDSVLTTSMYCLTSIQVHRFPSHSNPGRVSPPCRCWYSRPTDSRRLELKKYYIL